MAEYNLEELGERVKNIRKALNISQTEFGEKLGVSRSFISEIEKGGSKCGFDIIFNLSNTFNVNLYYLVHGEGEMFQNKIARPFMGSKTFGDPIETVNQMLWYLERSPLLKNTIMGIATKFLYENEKHIKKEIEKYETK